MSLGLWLIERLLLKDTFPERVVDITRTYLSELPRNLGIAIIASSIVLFFVDIRVNKLIVCFLLLLGIFLIRYSMFWDLDLMTEREAKDMKELIKQIKKRN